MQGKKPDADGLAKNLQASLAQRRPSTWKPVLGAIIVSSLLLTGMYLWLRPGGRVEPLLVVAFDGLFTQEEMPTARAQLFAPGESGGSRVSGQTLVFFEQMVAEPRKVVSQSDAKGTATADWPMPGLSATAFYVQHRDEGRKHQSDAVSGLLFVWPKDAPLLIVDADETLIADDVDENAMERLKLADDEGWRIVYLALKGSTALEYRQTAGWFDDRVRIPRGPILGRNPYPAEKAVESARRDLLTSLKSRFSGPTLVLVKSVEAELTSKDAGLPAIRLGDAKAGGVPWGDVPVRLK